MKKLLFGSMLAVFVMTSAVAEETPDSAIAATESVSEAGDSVAGDSAMAPAKEEPKKEEAAAPVVEETQTPEEPGMHEVVKEKMIEGGTVFMSIVLLCLIIGLAVAIERVITLNLATTNVKGLLSQVKEKLEGGDAQAAKEVCASTKGPVASIFAQGLVRMGDGIDGVEKSLENHGSAEMNKLEKGMTWISLFISLAPMFGFMGTVIGMIAAFDKIEAMGDIKIADVAGGIKTALLTTVAGLIVAVILQTFYNYLASKIDSIAGQLEDASNSFVDMLSVSGALKK